MPELEEILQSMPEPVYVEFAGAGRINYGLVFSQLGVESEAVLGLPKFSMTLRLTRQKAYEAFAQWVSRKGIEEIAEPHLSPLKLCWVKSTLDPPAYEVYISPTKKEAQFNLSNNDHDKRLIPLFNVLNTFGYNVNILRHSS